MKAFWAFTGHPGPEARFPNTNNPHWRLSSGPFPEKFFPEIGSPFPCRLFRLCTTPGLDLRVVAGSQNRRDAPPFEFLRPRIVRVLKEPALETFFLARQILPHDTRQKPDHRIEKADCRGFPARKDEIPDTYFFHLPRFDDPLVESLETPTKKHHTRPFGQLPHPFLGQGAPPRAQIDKRPCITFRGSLAPDGIDRRRHHIRPHHHARPAARWRIVHGTVPVGRKIADIDRFKGPFPRFKRPARERHA